MIRSWYIMVVVMCTLRLHAQPAAISLDIEAHAGGRGTYPGNSIPAFIHALTLGVNTLEMDCVISQDSQVVVSHDPFMNATCMRTPSGQEIMPENQERYNLFAMPYDSIRRYELGMKYDPEFPQQKRIKTYKPLLAEVLDSVETYVRKHHLPPIHYNIEIKSYRDADHFNPDPAAFAELVVAVLEEHGVEDRGFVQSFDVRPLQYLHDHYPSLSLSFLISKNTQQTLSQNLDQLGFTPYVYSPEYPMVDAAMIKEAQRLAMKIIPRTVDQETDWHTLIELGVDGIITNYPEQLILYTTKRQARQ